jgi:DDE superfamily endonuclease
VLAHLRPANTYSRLAAGFGVGVATVHRYVAQLVDLLAAAAPGLAPPWTPPVVRPTSCWTAR